MLEFDTLLKNLTDFDIDSEMAKISEEFQGKKIKIEVPKKESMFDLEIAQDIFKTHYTFTEFKSLIDPKLAQEILPLPPKNLLDHPNLSETRNFIVNQLFTS